MVSQGEALSASADNDNACAGGLSVVRGELGSQKKTPSQRIMFESFNSDADVELIRDNTNKPGPSESPEENENEALGSGDEDSDDNDEVQPHWKNGYKKWSFKWMREKCGMIVNHEKTELFIIVLIVINSIMMGIGTFDFVTENPAIDLAFQKTDKAFLIVFTIELGMQFIYRGWRLLMNGWLLFDLVIVVLSWSFEHLQIIRAFRIFRALRLITRIKTLRNLVMALFAVLPNLAAICLLLILIFYIFAVMFTTLFKDLEGGYFDRLDSTLFTLFQFMTLDFADIVRPVMEVYYWSWILFMIFLSISGFIVFNLIIAVVVDAVALIEREQKETDEDDEETTSDMYIDSSADERIQELKDQVSELLQKHEDMQTSMERLAQEVYRLHNIPPPPKPSEEDNGPDGEPS
mmetsp:Transcript_10745/g.31805  ORF Transcript_10745/g.31805 Transcript_10745/m.31805 type:complete len:406 (-) Transcript_10745:304-1521(-)|eukprot:CAMPEP_0113592294 /NCGR_PEP_ID=MMETSP0015_2-20120614/37754_1 /TAXON_ID=2838 /ORGANISM="Odontella" /LENGTH=405 /DNA_ID=CAMNT_0000498789 /DNA_START=167 /DNA_END=1384 /DNA_ORIENTATION=- /assembly_acc=CAM_ASM_000160